MPELSLIRKKEAVAAWNEGQLTDGQLIDLSVMYTDLIETLDAIGQTGSPMQVAARTRLNVVCDMIRAGVSISGYRNGDRKEATSPPVIRPDDDI